MTIEEIAKEILACRRCDLHKTRTQAVPGEGLAKARVMIVGEAPGRTEDLQGRPFVGRSGKLLDQILVQAGFDRRTIFITSVVKCRPPQNRIPRRIEQQTCMHAHLVRQMAVIAPAVIVLVGGVATKALLPIEGILDHRGRFIGKGKFLFFPTYHPAAGLRNPLWRKRFSEDVKKLQEFLIQTHSIA